ncbi:MAG TPA: D-cysteine desulfhydrase family protein [Dehalococcoidia bacterium]|nr:D-cysteine desulfhydrase family protein [Dehalococcoidia bacterium]
MLPAVEKLPRIRLGLYPTPLTEARHLSSILGGPRIFIKREDLSGLALGGNKCRKLEFILAEAKKRGANAAISTASSQSNFCLQLAAAARRLGMKPSFVLIKGVHIETQGNLLLHNILDSDVEILELTDIRDAFGDIVSEKMERVADDLRARGYNPFIMRHTIPDISAILGAVAWVDAADELITQLKEQNIDAQYVVLANGGGGTQAGLALGSKYLGASYEVMGISVFNHTDAAVAAVIKNTDAVSDFLGLGVRVVPDELEINDSYIGEGYGIPTKECIDAIKLVAQTEGIFLDPVYTGKAMAGLIDLVKRGRFKSTDTIVFIHTGGIPALFAYHQEIAR